MKLYEKYPQLREREQVIPMLIENVYATMQLESQPVSEEVLYKMAERIFDEVTSKWFELPKNQVL